MREVFHLVRSNRVTLPHFKEKNILYSSAAFLGLSE